MTSLRTVAPVARARRQVAALGCLLLVTALVPLSTTSASASSPPKTTRALPKANNKADASSAVGAAATPPNTPVVSPGLLSSTGVDNAGAAVTSFPLTVPAYHGLQPSLALTYNSRSGNGWGGVGWSLSGLSYLARLSITRGVSTGAASDLFTLDGQDLLPCPASTSSNDVAPSCRLNTPANGPTVTYRHYTTAGEHGWVIVRRDEQNAGLRENWAVTTPDGTARTYTLDRSTAASPGQPPVPTRLHLATVTDRLGRTVRYNYDGSPSGIPVLNSVTYDGYVVRAFSEGRPDRVRVADGSRVAVLASRLSTVAVYDDTTLVRAYHVAYTASGSTRRSVPASISTYGAKAMIAKDGGVTGTAVNVQRLSVAGHTARSPWTADSTNAAGTATDIPADNLNAAQTLATGLPWTWTGGGRTGDFEGDGRSEQLLLDSSNAGCNAWLRYVRPSSGTSKAITLHFSYPGRATWCTTSTWWAADMDGDGRADLVFQQHGGTAKDVLVVFRNNRGGSFTEAAVTAPIIPSASQAVCRPGDITGSGRNSIVCLYAPNNHQLDLPSHLITATPNASAGTLAATDVDPHFDVNAPTHDHAAFSGTNFDLGDVNGDGRVDLIHPLCELNTQGSHHANIGCRIGSPGFQTLLSTSAGFGSAVNHLPPSSLPAWTHPIAQSQAIDLNGDGLADYAAVTYPYHSNGHRCDALPTITTAIAHSDGTFTYNTDTVPNQFTQAHYGGIDEDCTSPMIEFGVLGADGTTGILMTLLRGGHSHATACAKAYAPLHPEVLRSVSRGDGTFDWPTSWDDCARTQEVDVDWSGPNFLEGLFASLVGFFFDVVVNAPVMSVGQQPLINPEQAIGVGAVTDDGDGNGTTDVLLFSKRVFTDNPSLAVAYTAPGDQHDAWRPVATTDDGDSGLISIVANPIGAEVKTLTHRATLPAKCGGVPSSGACSPYAYTAERLFPATDPGSPDLLLHESVARDWHVIDGLGNGRGALVYVESGHRLDRSGTLGTIVATYPKTATGWRNSPTVTRIPDRSAVVGPWLTATTTGGRAQLIAVTKVSGTLALYDLTEGTTGNWTSGSHPLRGPTAGLGPDRFWSVADVNGDHLSDLVHITPGTGSATVTTIAAAATLLWSAQRTPIVVDGADPDAAHWLVGDVNADGLSDVVHVDTDDAPNSVKIEAALSMGNGTWFRRPPIDHAGNGLDGVEADGAGPWLLRDTDADGSADLVHIVSATSHLPGRPVPPLDTVDVWPSVPTPAQFDPGAAFYIADPSSTHRSLLTADVDGDGAPDLVAATRGATAYVVRTQIDDSRIDRITSTDNGIGGTLSIAYKPASTWRAASGAQACLLPTNTGWLAVSSIRTDPGDGASTVAESYSCPRWSPSHERLLGWSGHTTTQPTSAAGAGSTVTDQRNLSDACGAETTSMTTSTLGGVAFSTKATTWDFSSMSPSVLCRPATATSEVCHANCATSGDGYSYDLYGNVVRDEQSETSAAGTHHRRTDTVYVYNPQTNLVDLTEQQSLIDEDATLARTLTSTRYCYDSVCGASVTPTRGQLTARTALDESGAGADRTTAYVYDGDGNVTSTTDPLGHTTTSTFDPVHDLYPVHAVNALGQSTSTTWDYGLGQPASMTDANQLTTRLYYDEFGRLNRRLAPGVAPVDRSYDDFGSTTQQIRMSTEDGSTTGLWQLQRFDGLGRVVLQARKDTAADGTASDSTADVTQSTYADTRDGVSQQTSWARTSWPAPDLSAVPATSYRYDELGRVTRLTHPENTAIAYNYGTDAGAPPNTTSITDESGHQVRTSIDPWGRTVSTQQGAGAAALVTTTTYDAADNPLSATDPAGNVTQWSYDSFGERTSETDADHGVSTTGYDIDGRVGSTSNAETTVTLTYDALDRLTRRHVAGMGDATWTYDQDGHGASAGRLTSEADPSATGCPDDDSIDLAYDAQGRASTQTYCVNGRAETTTASYDSLGRLGLIAYPDGLTTAIGYDTAGRINSTGDAVTAVTYDASNRASTARLGDGSTESLTYDTPRGWLNGATTTGSGGQAVDGFSVAHNANGTEQSRTITGTTAGTRTTATYGYDSSGQLNSTGGTDTQSTAYDAAANITTDSDVGTAQYPAAPCAPPACRQAHSPSAITAPGGTFTRTLAYDAHGNATTVAGPFATDHLSWNPLDQLQQVNQIPVGLTQTSASTSLTYNADGDLVDQIANTGGVSHEQQTFGALVSWDSTAGPVDQIRLANVVVATQDGTGRHYLHYDERGSLTSVTAADGTVTARVAYLPWGALAQQVGTLPATARGYTGAQPILASRYDLLGDRVYDPSQQRFLTPDDLDRPSAGVQGLNRYAYANNDPVNLVDPSGRDAEDIDDSGAADAPAAGDGASDDEWVTYSDSFAEEVTVYGDPLDLPTPPPLPDIDAMGLSAQNGSGNWWTNVKAGLKEWWDYGLTPESANALGQSFQQSLADNTRAWGAMDRAGALSYDPDPSVEMEEANLGRLQNAVDTTHAAEEFEGRQAVTQRTTAAVLASDEAGHEHIIVGGGTRDFSPRQRDLAVATGYEPAALYGAHGEPTVLQAVVQRGLTPSMLTTNQEACAICQITLTEAGGVMQADGRTWLFPGW